jgi:hypothetical protein
VGPTIRGGLVLVCCVVTLGAAGWFEVVVLRSATVAPTQVATAPVVVDANDDQGAARLTVLAPVWFASGGGGQRVVAAGTQFVTASAVLDWSMRAPATAAAGDTLSCDLRVRVSRGQPVIDPVRCEPGRTSPRG